MTGNQIRYWELVETKRANQAREKENARTNKANEQIKSRTNEITYQNAVANLNEQQRANLARELETNRSNLSNEEINRIKNAIQAVEAQTNRDKLPIEQAKANASMLASQASMANVGARYAELREQSRSNKVNEAIKALTQQEQVRSNKRDEELTQFRDIGNYTVNNANSTLRSKELEEQTRANKARELENTSSRLINQQLRVAELMNDINRTNSQTYGNALSTLGNVTSSAMRGVAVNRR